MSGSTINGSDDADTLVGDGFPNFIFGKAGDDNLDGGGGFDRLFGGIGNDLMKGGLGNDLLEGGPGADTMIGGLGDFEAGLDTASYRGAEAGVRVNLASPNAGAGDAKGDFLRQIRAIQGSDFNDTMDLRNFGALLNAVGGTFQFVGFEGDDLIRADGDAGSTLGTTLVGGSGNDTVIGSAVADMIFGDKTGVFLIDFGDDGEDGRDLLRGGAGADTIAGGAAGGDSLFGDAGDDLLFGHDGSRLFGGAGNDLLVSIGDNITMFGGGGNDTTVGNRLKDVMFGDAGDDALSGDDGNDDLIGGVGNDELFGGGDDDRLRGDEGDDGLDGGNGNDVLNGGTGDDILDGGQDNDRLLGGDGDDQLVGGFGNDQLLGGFGNDLVAGGDGDDLLRGGGGADLFTFFGDEAGADTIEDFRFGGADKIDLVGFDDLAFVGDGPLAGGGQASVGTRIGLFSTQVEIDKDGDGLVDLTITLRGPVVLGADDFLVFGGFS